MFIITDMKGRTSHAPQISKVKHSETCRAVLKTLAAERCRVRQGRFLVDQQITGMTGHRYQLKRKHGVKSHAISASLASATNVASSSAEVAVEGVQTRPHNTHSPGGQIFFFAFT